jgi:bile acid:Na+ symporter, BASS family
MTQLLLLALALVMLGLGLSLRVQDFARLRHHPKAAVVALGLQVVVLPLVCWGLIRLFHLSPAVAVGLMLLAASPGGVSANLFSHLFGGNVALNISLTAVNTLLSMVTLPLITQLAIDSFLNGQVSVPFQSGKVFEVIGIILAPVAAGMFIASRYPALAARLEKPFKILSGLVLAAFATIAVAAEWQALVKSALSIGGVVLSFNLISLLSGYWVSRASGLNTSMATAISYEIGIHNSTLAMYIALSVLKDYEMALPAAVYSVSMYLVATVFGFVVLRRTPKEAVMGAPAPGGTTLR